MRRPGPAKLEKGLPSLKAVYYTKDFVKCLSKEYRDEARAFFHDHCDMILVKDPGGRRLYPGGFILPIFLLKFML